MKMLYVMSLISIGITATAGSSDNMETCSFATQGVQMLFSNTSHIFLHDLSNGNTRTIYKEDGGSVTFIDYHYTEGSVYWSDSKTISRLKCPLGNQNLQKETIVQGGDFIGVAVDETNDYIYWTDMDAGTIKRAKLNGSNQQVIVDSLNRPAALRLDTKSGMLFFSDHGDKNIRTCKLDGSNLQTLVSGVKTPYGLAIDYGSDRIYWSDSADMALKSARLDGSDEKDVSVSTEAILELTRTPQPMGLDIYGNELYVSDLSSGIYRIAKNTNQAVPKSVISRLPQIYDVKITVPDGSTTSSSNRNRKGILFALTCLVFVLAI